MEPARVGPYEIERKLGAGGMGTVYLGKHVETGEPAAVKVLPASLAREEGFVARFDREIDALRRLTSPQIVALYDHGVDGETYYYAMEYVDGETLTARLHREKRIPWRETVALAVQICTALKAAHDAGVIHRDLKPSNLVITADGVVKLMDFGVAQVFAGTKLTVTGGIIGTVEYMSPEQAQGARATKKSDLYSLGAVMYAMLTGRPPFSGKTSVEVLQKHRFGQYDPPRRYVPEVPHWLDEIVCQLLEKEPDKRFPDAFVLSKKLQEAISRVDYALAQQKQTLAAGVGDGTDATLVQEPPADSGGGLGQATLMRNLLKAEIEHSKERSKLGRALDNTWVLVALLILLIAGGVWWFRARGLSQDAMYERGVALMREPAGEEWLRARDEYFLPLLAQDRLRWREEVEPHLREIALYELRVGGPSRARGRSFEPHSDAERFVLLARHHLEVGDLARAEATLSALEALMGDDERHAGVRPLAHGLRDELRARRDRLREDGGLLASAVARAEALTAAMNREEAATVWRAIIELYGDDPEARPQVERARQALAPDDVDDVIDDQRSIHAERSSVPKEEPTAP
ncbi:MAG: serine/threonine-protein kinase [Planctomycetaceae bacterium]